MPEINIQLSGDGTFVVPEKVTQIKVWCVGGGGGSSGNVSSNGVGRGGGGGALSYFPNYITVTPGTTIPYSVGVGGTAAPNTTSSGGNGTFSIFGNDGDAWYIFASPGSGGIYNGSVGSGGGANNTYGFTSIAGSPGGGARRCHGGAAGSDTGYTTGAAQATFSSPGNPPGGGASTHETQGSSGRVGGDGVINVTYYVADFDPTKFFALF